MPECDTGAEAGGAAGLGVPDVASLIGGAAAGAVFGLGSAAAEFAGAAGNSAVGLAGAALAGAALGGAALAGKGPAGVLGAVLCRFLGAVVAAVFLSAGLVAVVNDLPVAGLGLAAMFAIAAALGAGFGTGREGLEVALSP